MAVKTMKRIVLTAILLVVLAAAACVALVTCTQGTPLEDARTAALNTAIDQMGVKDRVKDVLSEHAQTLVQDYGIPEQFVNAGIDMLDIDDWKVANSPADAEVEKTVEVDVQGAPVQITTYDDPSVISVKGDGLVNTFGQTITFEVPESAQSLVKLLPYLDAAEEVGVMDFVGALADAESAEGAGEEA